MAYWKAEIRIIKWRRKLRTDKKKSDWRQKIRRKRSWKSKRLIFFVSSDCIYACVACWLENYVKPLLPRISCDAEVASVWNKLNKLTELLRLITSGRHRVLETTQRTTHFKADKSSEKQIHLVPGRAAGPVTRRPIQSISVSNIWCAGDVGTQVVFVKRFPALSTQTTCHLVHDTALITTVKPAVVTVFPAMCLVNI